MLPKNKFEIAQLAEALKYRWDVNAREKQRLPTIDFFIWCILAGRGFGKTRTGAETVREWIKTNAYVNLIGATADDARDIMIEGESGILSVCPKIERPDYLASKRQLKWPNGAISLIFTADEPERLRGKQHYKIWADEVACVIGNTLVNTKYGKKRIDQIKTGEYVYTRKGLRKVINSWQSSPLEEVYKLTSSNGYEIIGTSNHPVFVENKGFIPLSLLHYGDIINTWEQNKASFGTKKDTGLMAGTIWTGEEEAYTEPFIGFILEKFQSVLLFITKMVSKLIMTQKILRHCLIQIIEKNTNKVLGYGKKEIELNNQERIGKKENLILLFVNFVKKNIRLLEQEQNFVLVNALLRLEEKSFQKKQRNGNQNQKEKQNNKNIVHIAELKSTQKTQEPYAVQYNAEISIVLKVEKLPNKQAVYNLSVDECQEYYANGILVHNSWRYPESWDQAMMGLRLGTKPQGIVTTTPRPTKLILGLIEDKKNIIVSGTTYENKANLAAGFFDYVIKKYEGTRLGLQELEAKILTDTPGALWERAKIDDSRLHQHPDLTRVVVGVDPTASSTGDEAGIITAGKTGEHYYTIADDSRQGSPQEWATAAVTAYYRHMADCIVAEKNNGGEMVEAVIKQVDPKVNVKLVWASRGKETRAEPIAAIAAQGRDHHIGFYPKLEDELCMWLPGEKSPNRLDAKVWAMTELLGSDTINVSMKATITNYIRDDL